MRLIQTYRRSPYSVIASRWKRHFIHVLAWVGAAALVYAFVILGR
jgi:hypothetical protein